MCICILNVHLHVDVCEEPSFKAYSTNDQFTGSES